MVSKLNVYFLDLLTKMKTIDLIPIMVSIYFESRQFMNVDISGILSKMNASFRNERDTTIIIFLPCTNNMEAALLKLC